MYKDDKNMQLVKHEKRFLYTGVNMRRCKQKKQGNKHKSRAPTYTRPVTAKARPTKQKALPMSPLLRRSTTTATGPAAAAAG